MNIYPASVCYLWHNFSLSMRSYVASAAMWAAAHNPPVIVNQAKWHGKKRGRHICFTCLSMLKVSEKEYFAGNQHHQEPIILTGSGPVLLNHSHSPMNCTANAFHFWAPRTFTQSVTSVESFVAGCFWRQKWFSPREIITAPLHDLLYMYKCTKNGESFQSQRF